MAAETATLCGKCGNQLDPAAPGVRILSKSAGTMQCSHCASVDTRLRKLLGTWPLAETKGMSEKKVFDFYKKAHVAAGSHSLKTCVQDHLVDSEIDRRTDRNAGEWLPLEVWMNRGWKEDIVKRHPSREDEKKGLVFCVDIDSTIKDNVVEEVQAKIRNLMRKPKKVKETAETLPDIREILHNNKTTIEDGDGDDGGVSTIFYKSSTDESSSDSDRYGKKSKHKKRKVEQQKRKGTVEQMQEKTRKEKERQEAKQRRIDDAQAKKVEREKERAEVAARKALERENENARLKATRDAKNHKQRERALATKLLHKICTVKLKLDLKTEDTKYPTMEPLLKMRFESCHKEINVVHNMASNTLASPQAPALTITLATVTKMVQLAQETLAIVEKQFETQ